MAQERASLLQAHTDAIKKWNTGRRQMALLLAYYNYGRPDIKVAWEGAEASTTKLLNCAEKAFADYRRRKKPLADSCKPEQTAIDESLMRLSNAFEQSRQYSWEVLPAPKRIK